MGLNAKFVPLSLLGSFALQKNTERKILFNQLGFLKKNHRSATHNAVPAGSRRKGVGQFLCNIAQEYKETHMGKK